MKGHSESLEYGSCDHILLLEKNLSAEVVATRAQEEGEGNLVTRLIAGTTGVMRWLVGVVSILAKLLDKQGLELRPMWVTLCLKLLGFGA